jgi:type IX secretion system PorP/SprF family membrane protein
MVKMIRVGLVLFAFFLFLKEMKGQQVSLYNHYFYNPTILNPAYSGNREGTNLMLISRAQWTGFKGSPRLNLLSVDGSVMDRKMGLGAILFSDTKGRNKTIGGKFAYAYKITINEDSRINFGASLQFISHSIDFSGVIVQDEAEPTIFNDTKSKTNFDGNFGIAFFWKGLEVASSLNQLIKNKYNYFEEDSKTISFQPSFHYYNSIKYSFKPNPEKQIVVAPQILASHVTGSGFDFELNTHVFFNNKFWAGAAYKNDYAIAVNAGATLFNQLSVGYSYDFIVGDIATYSGISHELMLNYQFGKKQKKEKKEKEEKVKEEKKKENNKTVEKTDNKTESKEEEIEPVVAEKPKKEEVKKTPNDTTDVIILDATVDDFVGPNNSNAKKGVYVIVGSFREKEFAVKYKNTISQRGYPKADLFYSKTRNYNYVYMFVEGDLKTALQKIGEARAKGSKNAWIIILTE